MTWMKLFFFLFFSLRNIDKLNQLGVTTEELGKELTVEDIPAEYDRIVTDEPVSNLVYHKTPKNL